MKNKLLLIFFCLLITSNLYASFFVGINSQIELLVTQDESGYDNACFPTSFLYFLKLQPENDLYANIRGDSDLEKLSEIIEEARTTLAPREDRMIFEESNGVRFADGYYFMEKFLPENDNTYYNFAHRLEKESSPKMFLSRIHKKLKDFMRLKKPVMASFQYRYTKFEENSSYFSFGHFVVITEIQDVLEDGDLGFMIKYLDPEKGSIFSAYLYEEISDPFNAYLWSLWSPYDGNWSEGKRGVYNENDDFVSSPYLKLAAPYISPKMRWAWDVAVDGMLIGLMGLE